MTLDFDPATAHQFATTGTYIAAEVAHATNTTTAAVDAVPGLGLIGEDFRALLITAMTNHANHLGGCAHTVTDQADHVATYRAQISGLDQRIGDGLDNIGQL
ncbi:hypothetical protein [Nocardia fluminea]|uniref:hypothetical protein n=1 Tax=Nocardia fluminea TaxID=134984 RepID=UPI00364977A3